MKNILLTIAACSSFAFSQCADNLTGVFFKENENATCAYQATTEDGPILSITFLLKDHNSKAIKKGHTTLPTFSQYQFNIKVQRCIHGVTMSQYDKEAEYIIREMGKKNLTKEAETQHSTLFIYDFKEEATKELMKKIEDFDSETL